MTVCVYSVQCLMAGDSEVLSVQPKKGMALVTWHVQADGRPNHNVWHSACQALDGEHRYAIQKFKEFPRTSGEYVIDEHTKQASKTRTEYILWW